MFKEISSLEKEGQDVFKEFNCKGVWSSCGDERKMMMGVSCSWSLWGLSEVTGVLNFLLMDMGVTICAMKRDSTWQNVCKVIETLGCGVKPCTSCTVLIV